jgi:hypothetical protein
MHCHPQTEPAMSERRPAAVCATPDQRGQHRPGMRSHPRAGKKCAHLATRSRATTGRCPIEPSNSVTHNFTESEFTVGGLIGSKTAERMTTLLSDTLSIDSAFLRNHPRIARSCWQRPQPPILLPGCCFGDEGAPDGGLPLAIGLHANLSIPLPLRGHLVTKRVVGPAC